MPQTALRDAPFATWPIESFDDHQVMNKRSKACSMADQIQQVLRDSGYSELRLVAVSARDEVVVLEGNVSCFYLKQMAQTAALAVPDVQRISNELKVS